MDSIPFGRRALRVPTGWQDLTSRQLEALADLMSRSLPAQRVKFLFILYVLQWQITGEKEHGIYAVASGLRRFTLTLEQLTALAATQSYLMRKNERTGRMELDVRLTRDPYPRVRGMRGPGDGLEHLTYDQFAYAEYFQSLLEDDPGMLPSLLACLWHTRRIWSPDGIGRDARKIAALPFQRQQAMFWLWQGSLSFLQSRYPRVFRLAGADSVSGNAAHRVQPSRIFEQQLRVIDALAGGDVTKKQQVREGYLYDAIITMDEALRRDEELRDRIARHK